MLMRWMMKYCTHTAAFHVTEVSIYYCQWILWVCESRVLIRHLHTRLLFFFVITPPPSNCFFYSLQTATTQSPTRWLLVAEISHITWRWLMQTGGMKLKRKSTLPSCSALRRPERWRFLPLCDVVPHWSHKSRKRQEPWSLCTHVNIHTCTHCATCGEDSHSMTCLLQVTTPALLTETNFKW